MLDCEAARRLALELPEVEERDHFGRPSFRVRNKIFATLWTDEQHAVLKLAPGDQWALTALDPLAYSPVPGAWGGKGWTRVQLRHVKREDFRRALDAAWRQVAPKRLAATYQANA